jgi:hypothetical protein
MEKCKKFVLAITSVLAAEVVVWMVGKMEVK